MPTAPVHRDAVHQPPAPHTPEYDPPEYDPWFQPSPLPDDYDPAVPTQRVDQETTPGEPVHPAADQAVAPVHGPAHEAPAPFRGPADQAPPPAPVDPLFPGELPPWQRRIVPSPPPQRGRLIKGLLVGLLAGAAVFGTLGFVAGRWTADAAPGPPPATTAAPGPSGSPPLPPYEQSQASLNAAKFSGELATFAQPWLPWLSGCIKNGDKGGPALQPGEAARVLCEYGSMNAYFVQYRSLAERDKARIANLGRNVDARQLTPGAATGTDRRATPSGRTEGGYIEYAYRTQTGTVSALWWDDADTPVGGYLLAFWKEGLGSSWEPMRDVWRRHA